MQKTMLHGVEIAKKSSHKAFADKVPGGDKLMEMALAVK